MLITKNGDTGKFVITRFDYDRCRSVPLSGKSFDAIEDAVIEATRLNDLGPYRSQFLMVDLASAYRVATPPQE